MNSQRRGPIAAEFSGPGPAAIALPTLFGSKIFKYLADKFSQAVTMFEIQFHLQLICDFPYSVYEFSFVQFQMQILESQIN